MFITRTILRKAIENKVPLFHNGDFIDDDVLYDLFYSPREQRLLPGGKKNWASVISKEDRQILCAELKGYENSSLPYDVIYYNMRCKSCGKNVPVPITKSKIIHRSFKKKCVQIESGTPTQMGSYYYHYISFDELFELKFGNPSEVYVCQSCINKFISESNEEALEILRREDKFEWYLSDADEDDWRKRLFYKESHCVGTKICAVDGDCWTDDEYNEWQNKLRQEKEEELNHQRELEKIRRQRKVDEEAELIKTRRANELFLARHQRNTPTQNYINKFCNRHSKVDFKDKEVLQEALEPEGINYELVQKHNSKLYREYLQTPLWKLISSKVKWNAHERCEKCGSKSHLEIHHNSYEFKGVEFLDFKSLKCLCSKCHQEEHDKLDF